MKTSHSSRRLNMWIKDLLLISTVLMKWPESEKLPIMFKNKSNSLLVGAKINRQIWKLSSAKPRSNRVKYLTLVGVHLQEYAHSCRKQCKKAITKEAFLVGQARMKFHFLCKAVPVDRQHIGLSSICTWNRHHFWKRTIWTVSPPLRNVGVIPSQQSSMMKAYKGCNYLMERLYHLYIRKKSFS